MYARSHGSHPGLQQSPGLGSHEPPSTVRGAHHLNSYCPLKASFKRLRVKLNAEKLTLEHVAAGVGAHGRNTCKPRTWEVEVGDSVIAYIMSLRSKWVPGDPVSKTGLYVGAPLFFCFVFSAMWLHVKLERAAVHCTCFSGGHSWDPNTVVLGSIQPSNPKSTASEDRFPPPEARRLCLLLSGC